MSTKEEHYTPPSSDIEPDQRLPPSPPASPKPTSTPRSDVDRLIGFLRLARAGRPIAYTADSRIFKLSTSEFEEFERRVGADEGLWGWYQDKARWDYDPRDGEYVLRMPTRVHESFIQSVQDLIKTEISSLADRLEAGHDEETAEALRRITKGGSPTLELYAPKLENSSQSSQSTTGEVVVHHSPDATFYHEDDDSLPALVVEVSYSQQRKDLPRLAESYIVDSQHQIRCVVGLDITYASRKKGAKKDKTASVSIWRPAIEQDAEGEDVGICRCDTDAVPFRDTAGETCDGNIQLSIADLLPASVLAKLPKSATAHHIAIDFAKLFSFLNEAEAEAKPVTASAPLKFRKRKRTPPDRLSEEREASYVKHEEAELDRERKKDDEWQGAGWRNDAGGEVELELRRSKRSKKGDAD